MWQRFIFKNRRFCRFLTNKIHFDVNSTISNKIIVKNTNEELLNIKYFQFYNILYNKSQDIQIVEIYPSSIEKYNEYCEILTDSKIIFTKHCINPEQDILLQNSLCTNVEIEGYKYQYSDDKLKYYLNLPIEVQNKYFFNNFPPNGFISNKKYYLYNKKNYKISPNILKVKNFIGLNEDIIRKVLEGYNINRIDSPNTNDGFWLVYIGDKDSYTKLLTTIFHYENKNINFFAHYQTANIYPIGEKSKNIIEVYSRDKRLPSDIKLMQAINCEECRVNSLRTINGMLYTIYFNDLKAYESVLFKNGLPLNGTIDYSMSFGDKISMDNILAPPIYLDFPFGYAVEAIKKLKNYEFQIHKYGSGAIIKPKNQDELNQLNNGIKIGNKTFFINASRSAGISVKDCIVVPKSENQEHNEDYYKLKFHPMHFNSVGNNSKNYFLNFKSEDYFSVFFKDIDFSHQKDKLYSCYIPFITDSRKFLMPFIFKFNYKDEDSSNIKFPFNYHHVKTKDRKVFIKVPASDFFKYVHKELEINGEKIQFLPLYIPITEERTYLKCHSKRKVECKNFLSSENIFCEIDQTQSIIYPKIKNREELIKFYILFNIWDLNISASALKIGKDILELVLF